LEVKEKRPTKEKGPMEIKATKEQLGELRTFSQETGRSFNPNVSFEEAERILARRRRRSQVYWQKLRWAGRQALHESTPPTSL
jgi:hypothetical protein